MNVGTILRPGLPWCDRLVHRLRPLDGVGWLRYVGFGWLFLHIPDWCNKPACERRA